MAASLLLGCGGAVMQVAALDDVERARAAPATQEGAKLAPEAYARAEQERRIALEEHAAGDDVGAVLHAQRAVAAYGHALAVVRLARATTELADAQKTLDDATTQVQAIEGSRAQLEREAAELDERVRLSRERLLPASSAPATGEHEAARLVAARALAVEARLLCGAARLITADAAGLADADGEIAKLDGRLAMGPRPAPIDTAARVRARCLDVLTRARRASGDDAGASDALLSELSASGGWDPARDERGVVVTLHDAFRGAELGADATTRLKDLGRVAAAHPGFAVQVVVHDAVPSRPKDDADARRAGAAVQALVAGGASAGRIKPELAGTRAPLVDPGDAKQRARNERLDVVFIASGK
jgi:flagellar motor protein MotB